MKQVQPSTLPILAAMLACMSLCSCSLERFADPFDFGHPKDIEEQSVYPPPEERGACANYTHRLKLTMLNVGQGEALLITCPNSHKQTLIDAGQYHKTSPSSYRLFRSALLAELGEDRTLELAINTHPHEDHVGGFLSLLENQKPLIRILTYLDNGANNPKVKFEEKVRAIVKKQGGRYLSTKTTDISSLVLCEASKNTPPTVLEFIKLSKKEQKLLGCPKNLNDCSLAAKLTHGRRKPVSVLLAADGTTRWEKVVLNNPELARLLPSAVLKVGHHGESSLGENFLLAANPDFALISSGLPRNQKPSTLGYPSFDIIKRLNSFLANKLGRQQQFSDEQLWGCIKQKSGCQWRALFPVESLFTTAHSGSVFVYIQEGELCLTTESLDREVRKLY